MQVNDIKGVWVISVYKLVVVTLLVVFDFIMSVVYGHGRCKRLGTCLVQMRVSPPLQCGVCSMGAGQWIARPKPFDITCNILVPQTVSNITLPQKQNRHVWSIYLSTITLLNNTIYCAMLQSSYWTQKLVNQYYGITFHFRQRPKLHNNCFYHSKILQKTTDIGGFLVETHGFSPRI